MITVNRTAIVVRPGQPFLDWLHRADPTSNELSLEDLRREPKVYLLPECENEEEAREYLQEVCDEIFEEQLDGWYRLPSTWPNRRDLYAFDRWFEWSFHSMVVDLCDDPLLREEM
jgi:hypothetical protein